MHLRWAWLILVDLIILVYIWFTFSKLKFLVAKRSREHIFSFSKLQVVWWISFFLFVLSSIVLIGRVQQIRKLKPPEQKIDIMIVLDTSGSMEMSFANGKSSLDVAKESLVHFLDLLPQDKFRVGLVIFGSYPYLSVPIISDFNLIKQKIELTNLMDLPFITDPNIKGMTDIASALVLAGIKVANLQPPDYKVQKDPNKKPGAIVLITDGMHNSETMTLEQSVGFLRKYKIRVYPILVLKYNNEIAWQQMEFVAKQTNGFATRVSDANGFRTVVEKIAKLEKNKVQDSSKQIFIDAPEAFFLILLLSSSILIYVKIYLTYGGFRDHG